MKTIKIYKDTIHGIKAIAYSRTGAWMLIWNECRSRGVEVPIEDEIVELTYDDLQKINHETQRN